MNFKEGEVIYNLIISPNNEYIAYRLNNPHYYDKTFFVIHVDTGHRFELKSDCFPGKIMCFSPCSNYLITSKSEARERNFFIWDFHSDKIIYKNVLITSNKLDSINSVILRITHVNLIKLSLDKPGISSSRKTLIVS